MKASVELVNIKSKSSDNAMNYGEEEDDIVDVEDVPLVQQNATVPPPRNSRRPQSNMQPSNLIDDDDYETPSTCCRNLIILGVVWGLLLVFADVKMIFQKRKFNIQPIHVANATIISPSPSMSPTPSK